MLPYGERASGRDGAAIPETKESKNTPILPQSRACAVGEQSSIALKRNIALENLEEEITRRRRRLLLKMEAPFFDARDSGGGGNDDVIIIAWFSPVVAAAAISNLLPQNVSVPRP